MSEPDRVIIQSAVTKQRHKQLYDWWTDGKGDKGATVRAALLWFFNLKARLDRIEELLEMLVREVQK